MTPRFRVWDGEEMHEPPHKYHIDGEGELWTTPCHGFAKAATDYSDHEVMLFTGLADADGTEIWEGNVMKVGEQRAVVDWRQKPNGFYLDFIGRDDSSLIGLQLDHPNGAIVIGNRYENPELLDELSA